MRKLILGIALGLGLLVFFLFALLIRKSPPAGEHPSNERSIDLGGDVILVLIHIEPGEFEMGSPEGEEHRDENEGPRHRVKIEKPFWIGKYEVTQAQWEAVMGANPSNLKGKSLPVDSVSWDDCQEFLKRLNAKVGGPRFRLPTEAEWEYAYRAGTATPFFFGEEPGSKELSKYAWYEENSGRKTHPVGEKLPNPWGLHDMAGNIWEWCQSAWRKYPYDPRDGREDLSLQEPRVLRGGSWSHYDYCCRASHRHGFNPSTRDSYIGLRLARDADGS